MTPKKIPSKKKEPAEKPKKHGTTSYAIGRRKESVARVYYFVSPNHEVSVNTKPYDVYFPYLSFQRLITQPFTISGRAKGKWKIVVRGGGTRGQAEAIRLGISRILIMLDENLRPVLKKEGLLTRDPRVKERKKYGLKRARRAPQWQKR